MEQGLLVMPSPWVEDPGPFPHKSLLGEVWGQSSEVLASPVLALLLCVSACVHLHGPLRIERSQRIESSQLLPIRYCRTLHLEIVDAAQAACDFGDHDVRFDVVVFFHSLENARVGVSGLASDSV